MVGSKGKGSGEGGQKRRAHASSSAARSASYAPRARSVGAQRRASCTCVCASRKWCGDGAYSKYAESDAQRGGGAHMRALARRSPRRGCWDRVTGSRRRLTGYDMLGGMFLAHFRRWVFVIVIAYSDVYAVHRSHPEAVVFKGLHAVCFPGHGEGRYNNVMHS